MNHLKFNASEIVFRPAIQSYIYETMITPKVEEFLNARGVSIEQATEIKGRASITDLNFAKISTKYFYNKLLKDVKTKNGRGFSWSKYYTITFDKRLAIIECTKTGLFYNEMYLGKVPILFFICFDLQEILDAVRRHAQS